jgi:hypothetical protein
MSVTLYYIIFASIIFFLAVLFIRWVFGIHKIVGALNDQVEQNRMQIRLLEKLLMMQGATKEEIEQAVNKH